MKLFEVVNGSIGESYVRVFVNADCDSSAIEIARQIYVKCGYNVESLRSECVFHDTSKVCASGVRDY